MTLICTFHMMMPGCSRRVESSRRLIGFLVARLEVVRRCFEVCWLA
jgi:hypothetical protein